MSSDAKPAPNAVAKALQPYVTGGGSAIFASICVHPMDLTKTRMQLMPKGTSPIAVAKNIIAQDGAKGLYAGLSASIMRQAVYGTARLGLHREFSDSLKRSQGGGDLSALASAGSAMAAGAIASVIGTPFDVSLVRMQADGMKPAAERRGYKNVFDAIARISREEGVTKLWRGFEPTAFRAIAMNVGMMASYDQAKQAIRKVNGDNVATNLSASAISGFTASFTSLPFDMMKTRLQNMKPDPATGQMPYKNVLDCGMKIAQQEGVLTFWRGFSAYYARTAPHAMIILIVLEQFNKAYSQFFALKNIAVVGTVAVAAAHWPQVPLEQAHGGERQLQGGFNVGQAQLDTSGSTVNYEAGCGAAGVVVDPYVQVWGGPVYGARVVLNVNSGGVLGQDKLWIKPTLWSNNDNPCPGLRVAQFALEDFGLLINPAVDQQWADPNLVQACMQRVYYTNNQGNSATAGTRTVKFEVFGGPNGQFGSSGTDTVNVVDLLQGSACPGSQVLY